MTTGDGNRIGVWLVGVHGGLATTMLVGARLIARGVTPPTGLVTANPEFGALDLVGVDELVFGGHDIRGGTVAEAARAIAEDNGTIQHAHVALLEDDLAAIDAEVRSGDGHHCGPTIAALTGGELPSRGNTAREVITAIRSDLESFRERNGLDRLVVVDVASTEPPAVDPGGLLETADGVRKAIDDDGDDLVRASLLYAVAAIEAGAAFINFTPNAAACSPGVLEMARAAGVPVMGNDGKTGETLVKSALAPMFRARALRVLSWQGYNILGDRDGQVLADPENKRSKVDSKDSVLGQILGYPLHTHVGIDYVPSLGDMKTAWDFIHFQGFLDFKMSMQFTWHGCDAILAAPLVLDMVRLAELSLRRGESGAMPWLAPFFKSPVQVDEQDLHRQMASLYDYAARVADSKD